MDERGVPLLSGREAIPSAKGIAVPLVLGIATVVAAAVLVAWISLLFGASRPASGVGGIVGGVMPVFIMTAGRKYRLRRDVLRLTPAAKLAARFGTDSLTLERLASERSILPRYNVNGTDYYDPDDFGDAAILLRPASVAEDLLRPVVGCAGATENLLRSVGGASEEPSVSRLRLECRAPDESGSVSEEVSVPNLVAVETVE